MEFLRYFLMYLEENKIEQTYAAVIQVCHAELRSPVINGDGNYSRILPT
jgi:hypothetical protein